MKIDLPFIDRVVNIIAHINSVQIFLEKTKKKQGKQPSPLTLWNASQFDLVQEFSMLTALWVSLAGCVGPTGLIFLVCLAAACLPCWLSLQVFLNLTRGCSHGSSRPP